MAGAVALAFPIGYYSVQRGAVFASARAMAEVQANEISRFIGTNPDLWMFQGVRLSEMLTLRSGAGQAFVRVLGADQAVVAQSGEAPEWPFITESVALYDSGTPIGKLEVNRSLRPALHRTVLAALLGCLLAAAVFVVLRVLPLRALRRAIDELSREKERAQVTLHSIGDGVITVDARQCVEHLNPVAAQLTGWALGDARGRPVSDVFCLIDQARAKFILTIPWRRQ